MPTCSKTAFDRARHAAVVSELCSYIKKDTEKAKQMQMWKEQNILRGWQSTKNAHSRHRLIEMERYQTADPHLPINRYTNIH